MTVKPFTVVIPTVVNESNLVSHTVLENEYPLWSANTNYSTGDRVIYVHKIYQATGNHTHGTPPSEDTINWVLVGPTNRYSAFDESGGTFTTATNSMEFVISGSKMDSFGFLDITAVTVRIRASSALYPQYYDKTFTLEDKSEVNSWFTYFSSNINRSSVLTVFDIPSIPNSTYTITIQGSGAISLGTFVMGKAKEFGFVEYGCSVSTRSFGRIEEDQFGRRTRIRRGFAKRMNVSIFIDKNTTDFVKRQFEELRETPALWVGVNEVYDSTTIYGDYKDFSIVLTYPDKNNCSIEIEGIA